MSGTADPGGDLCRWCGGVWHRAGQCPRVHSIEFHEDGVTVRKVTFRPVQPQIGGIGKIEWRDWTPWNRSGP